MDEQDRAELFDAVLMGLASLIAGSDDRRDTVYERAALRGYDGFELFHSRLSDPDDMILMGANAADVPVWPMDARWGGPHNLGNDPWAQAGSWIFKRVTTLNPKVWRGKVRRVFPRMVEMAESLVQPDGTSLGSVAPMGIVGRGLVDCMAHNHPLMGYRLNPGEVHTDAVRNDKGDMSSEAADFGLAQGVELRREYLWSVLLGEEGVPRARFVTDPIGVREAFRLRDIPAGRARRAALRHWVMQHWRKRRETTETDRVFVREYLRGSTAFGWNGLSCVIEPSREDMRRNREVKAA